MSLSSALSAPKRRHHKLGHQAWQPNVVLLSLSVAMLGVVWLLSSVQVAPNRIVLGTSYDLLPSIGWVGSLLVTILIATIGLLALLPSRKNYRVILVLVAVALLLMPFGLMVADHRLIDSDLPQARLGIGAAYWALMFILLLCLVELRMKLGMSRLITAILLCAVGISWWLCTSLWLENLALMQEFRTREQQFWRALWQHISLVSMAVGVSIVLGVTLAMLMRRYPKLHKAIFTLLNFLQTIPSLALFGLLLAPLAWLSANVPVLAQIGVSGIGTAPALIALIGYSLLPIVRNTYIALDEVSIETLDAAKAMGMRSRQRFLQVRFPLALPLLLEGVRITAVQAIGLTAVAALIGAGGLGTFIFQGLGQAAMDMVLLGALPILLLALIVDAVLGALAAKLRPGGYR